MRKIPRVFKRKSLVQRREPSTTHPLRILQKSSNIFLDPNCSIRYYEQIRCWCLWSELKEKKTSHTERHKEQRNQKNLRILYYPNFWSYHENSGRTETLHQRDDRVATKKLKTKPNDWFNKNEEGDAKRKDHYEKRKEFEISI